jgi:hypothetical protein
MPKHKLLKGIPLHDQGLNYRVNICELKYHVREKGWSLNWLTKFGLAKKLLQVFLIACYKMFDLNLCYPMACHPTMWRQNETQLG